MFAQIGDVLPRFRVFERLFGSHERLVHALALAYVDILGFCPNAKAVFRRGRRPSGQLPPSAYAQLLID